MSVSAGQDYMFDTSITYIGPGGIGDGCLLGTKQWLIALPTRANNVRQNPNPNTPFSLDSADLPGSIQRALADPRMTPDLMDAFIKDIAHSISDAACFELEKMGRVRVRNSWFSRGMYVNPKPGGIGGWSGWPIKGKETVARWVAFYQTLPNFVS